MIESILSGICIALGSLIYLKNPNVIGAILFSVGLIIILNLRLKLYTGVVGYIKTRKDIFQTLKVLIGNIIGCCIMFCYPIAKSTEIMANKLSNNFGVTFVNACLCGIIIYAAVECFRKEKDYLVILLIPAFILSGAEHSIADICYIISTRQINVKVIIFILIVIFGNAAGALLMNWGGNLQYAVRRNYKK